MQDITPLKLAQPWIATKVILNFCLDAVNAGKAGSVRFVQVGANDGVMADPVRRFLEYERWSGVMIEPLPVA